MSAVVADVLTTSDQYAIGIPPNNGVYFDGSRYWLFYTQPIEGPDEKFDTSELKYCTADSVDALCDNKDLSTNMFTSNKEIVRIRNNGRCYAIDFNVYNGKKYAYALISGAQTGWGYKIVRWELTSQGLAYQKLSSDEVADKNRLANYLTPSYSGELKYFGSSVYIKEYIDPNTLKPVETSCITTRRHDANLSTKALGGIRCDEEGFKCEDIRFPEHARLFKLSDKYYLAFLVDQGDDGEQNGNFGHAREWEWRSETDDDASWSNGKNIDVYFNNQNYALETSHIGQNDICQLSDGRIFVAYCDNKDKENGNFGKIILKCRENGEWNDISQDVIGNDTAAWHIAIASNGTNIWILYVKNRTINPWDAPVGDEPAVYVEDDGGEEMRQLRDNAIHFKKYDVSTKTFDDERLFAKIQVGHRFHRMFTQWRFHNNKLVAAWTEKNLSKDEYHVMVGSVDVS